MPEITFGKFDATWEQYGLTQAPILINGERTGYKAILRGNQLISIVGEGYKLIPNEEAVKIADEAAKLAGLVPFHEFTGGWFNRLEKHVIQEKDGTRIHALYAINREYDVNGDKMHLGVGVHNSIDGSTGFGCGVFTFRHACSNMVWAGMKGYEQEFDQRKTIAYIYKRHTKNMFGPADNVKDFLTGLKNTILEVMEKANIILETYRKMADELVTEEFIKAIQKSRLPKKILPEYLKKPIEELEGYIPAVTQWDVYNDITAAIWHNAKTGLKTKDFQFKVLHELILPKVK